MPETILAFFKLEFLLPILGLFSSASSLTIALRSCLSSLPKLYWNPLLRLNLFFEVSRTTEPLLISLLGLFENVL